MTVELIHVDLEEKPVLSNLMQHCRHDLSEFIDIVVNHEGLFDLGPYFDLYWTESTRHPFFVFDDGALVGFALAREYDRACYEVAEFFILRKTPPQGCWHRRCHWLYLGVSRGAGVSHKMRETPQLKPFGGRSSVSSVAVISGRAGPIINLVAPCRLS